MWSESEIVGSSSDAHTSLVAQRYKKINHRLKYKKNNHVNSGKLRKYPKEVGGGYCFNDIVINLDFKKAFDPCNTTKTV